MRLKWVLSIAGLIGWFGPALLPGQDLILQAPVESSSVDVASKANVKFFLETTWPKVGDNEALAKQKFQELGGAKLEDPQILLAYGYNLINRSRYREALPVFEQLTRTHPKSVEGWVAKSWLESTLHSPNEALVSLQRLKLACVDLANDPDAMTKVLEHAGRVVGYHHGPLSSKANPDTLKETMNRVAQGLTVEQLATFNNSVKEIVDKFAGLDNDLTTAASDFKANARIEQDRKIQQLNVENQNLNARRGQIPGEIAQIGDKFLTMLGPLQSQLTSLQSEYGRVQGAHNNLQLQLQNVYFEIANYQAQLRNSRVVYFPPGYLFQLNNQVAVLQSQILGAQNQMAMIDQQMFSTNQQIQNVIGQRDAQIGGLNAESANLNRSISRNTKEIERLGEDPKSLRGEAANLSSKIDKMSSYYKFPVEQARHDLLLKVDE